MWRWFGYCIVLQIIPSGTPDVTGMLPFDKDFLVLGFQKCLNPVWYWALNSVVLWLENMMFMHGSAVGFAEV